jgi:hypothetical protein
MPQVMNVDSARQIRSVKTAALGAGPSGRADRAARVAINRHRSHSPPPDTVTGVPDPDVTIRLPHDKALVLLEWLYRLSERKDFNEIVSHPAERVAVWALHGNLESQSIDIFRPDYGEWLDAARQRLAPPGSEF